MTAGSGPCCVHWPPPRACRWRNCCSSSARPPAPSGSLSPPALRPTSHPVANRSGPQPSCCSGPVTRSGASQAWSTRTWPSSRGRAVARRSAPGAVMRPPTVPDTGLRALRPRQPVRRSGGVVRLPLQQRVPPAAVRGLAAGRRRRQRQRPEEHPHRGPAPARAARRPRALRQLRRDGHRQRRRP